METNANTIERIMYYFQNEEYEKAETLAKVCDHLEECYSWDLTWDTDDMM